MIADERNELRIKLMKWGRRSNVYISHEIHRTENTNRIFIQISDCLACKSPGFVTTKSKRFLVFVRSDSILSVNFHLLFLAARTLRCHYVHRLSRKWLCAIAFTLINLYVETTTSYLSSVVCVCVCDCGRRPQSSSRHKRQNRIRSTQIDYYLLSHVHLTSPRHRSTATVAADDDNSTIDDDHVVRIINCYQTVSEIEVKVQTKNKKHGKDVTNNVFLIFFRFSDKKKKKNMLFAVFFNSPPASTMKWNELLNISTKTS